MALTSAEYQEIGSLNGRRPWFVRKKILDGTTDASDANDGKSPNTAKLTIGSAVTAAANGDAIIVGPGTFDEKVDGSAKSLLFKGAGLDTILTNNDTAYTLKIGGGSIVENMVVNNTATITASGQGIAIQCVKSNATLRNVYSKSTGRCVHLVGDAGVGRFTVDNCVLIGSEYAAYFQSSDILVKDSVLRSLDWTLCQSGPIGYKGAADTTTLDAYDIHTYHLQCYNTKLYAQRSEAKVLQDYKGCCLWMEGGAAKLVGCSLSGWSKLDATMVGVCMDTVNVVIGRVSLEGCEIYLSSDGGGLTYDFYNASTTVGENAVSAFPGVLFSVNGQCDPSKFVKGTLPASSVRYNDSSSLRPDSPFIRNAVTGEPSYTYE